MHEFFGDAGYTRTLLSGATDVLRIAAYLSDRDSDLSLKEPVRFRLSTREKKNLLSLLDGLERIEEDMLRHRETWLRLGEIVNPGTKTNRRRYPDAFAAFDRLRNAPGRIDTFNRTVEAGIRSRTVDEKLLKTLAARPGEFMRRLDFLLRTADDPQPVIDHLGKVAARAQTGMLFAILKYLSFRKDAKGEERVFIPKGRLTKVKAIEDRRVEIPAETIEAAEARIEEALHERLSSLEPMGRVYIDPRLSDILVPFNRRADSSANVAMIKGSRYPLGAAPVIRLFAWWKGHVDVDLSAVFYDAGCEEIGQIAYFNLESDGALHSGDIQNAPEGAAEFIDLDIERLRKRGIRYVITSLISFRGTPLSEVSCFSGFMERDSLRSGRKFEPESVVLRFDAQGDTTTASPLIFDLEKRKMIFADLAAGNHAFTNVRNSSRLYSQQLRSVLGLAKRKPTCAEILSAHAKARGSLVDQPEDADTVFLLEDIDVDEIIAMAAGS